MNRRVQDQPGVGVVRRPNPKLTTTRIEPPFKIVLVEPEIPQNTGSIARTCAATNTALHLVGKLGFRIDEHAVRRAGLDYWPLVDLSTHDSFEKFEQAFPNGRVHLLAPNSERNVYSVDIAAGDAFIFGRESVGLPDTLLSRYADRVVAIPTSGEVRSLNLSNAVAIVLYEALRRIGAFEVSRLA